MWTNSRKKWQRRNRPSALLHGNMGEGAAPGEVLGSPQAAGGAPERGLLADAGVEQPPGFLESRRPRGLPLVG